MPKRIPEGTLERLSFENQLVILGTLRMMNQNSTYTRANELQLRRIDNQIIQTREALEQ